MIFVIHYILFNAGLSAIIILQTLFLQTYSDASLTEIGALLMVLPFATIIVKPLFCAIADRHQAHKRYLIISLLIMATGYGSLAVAPFFPDFYQQHGRLVWYMDIVGIIVGFCAFGVAWSLGDALSVNAARVKRVPWGSIRVWATVSWGAFGVLIGQINETPLLPKYVPAFLVLVGALVLEAFLLAVWSDAPFDMSAEPAAPKGADAGRADAPVAAAGPLAELEMDESQWHGSLTGTLNGSARINPRLMGAMANLLMEDVGGSIKSSLRGRSAAQKRTGLADILEQNQQLNSVGVAKPVGEPQQQQQSQQSSPALANKWQHSPIALNKSLAAAGSADSQSVGGQLASFGSSGTLGRAALRRTQRIFSPMNSLSSASGHAIAEQLARAEGSAELGGALADSPKAPGRQRAQVMTMSSLGGAAAARAAMQLSKESDSANLEDSFASVAQQGATTGGALTAAEAKSVEELQIILLKVIVKRDRQVLKSLLLFTLFGVLFTIHMSYFFLHVEKICREKDYDFSSVTGYMVASQSLTEIVCFVVVVPYVLPLIGRTGAFLLTVLLFGSRYAFYGTYYVELSPYSAVATETMQGVAYAIIYTLITDIATECVDKVDEYMPELIQRRLIHPQMDPNQLKLPLRATMQGVFSGAFDGLGNGIGALVAGIYLESFSYISLWRICAGVSAVSAVVYTLSEWQAFCGSSGQQRKQQQAEIQKESM